MAGATVPTLTASGDTEDGLGASERRWTTTATHLARTIRTATPLRVPKATEFAVWEGQFFRHGRGPPIIRGALRMMVSRPGPAHTH